MTHKPTNSIHPTWDKPYDDIKEVVVWFGKSGDKLTRILTWDNDLCVNRKDIQLYIVLLHIFHVIDMNHHLDDHGIGYGEMIAIREKALHMLNLCESTFLSTHDDQVEMVGKLFDSHRILTVFLQWEFKIVSVCSHRYISAIISYVDECEGTFGSLIHKVYQKAKLLKADFEDELDPDLACESLEDYIDIYIEVD